MDTAMAISMDDREVVLGLLRRQAILSARLEQFAGQQRSLVRTDRSGPLLSLLADRQRLSATLAELAAQLAPFRRAWSAVRAGLDDRGRAEADELIEEAGSRLKRVIEGDEQDARLLAVKKRRAADELSETCHAVAAVRAYAGSRRGAGGVRLDEAS